MTDKPKLLRDFLYLDMERVRSFIAQLLEGVPETLHKGSGADVSVEGGIEGSLPFLLKGKAGADYRYFRSQDETRSLHHHAYTLFEKHLAESDRLRFVDAALPTRRGRRPCSETVRWCGCVGTFGSSTTSSSWIPRGNCRSSST
ncbi:MAG: hypothetical protein FJX75_00265 [Armatimonadetes bacterium]|nr:hypothetical protein [Armatimonadota bacterium]